MVTATIAGWHLAGEGHVARLWRGRLNAFHATKKTINEEAFSEEASNEEASNIFDQELGD
jgi:hypothetical protein